MKFLTVIALIIASFVVFVKFAKPAYDEAYAIKQKISQVDELIEKVNNIKVLREKLSRNYAQFTDERLERLRKILPDHVDNIKLLLDIDGIASQYEGMRLSDVKLSKAQDENQNQEDVTIETETEDSIGSLSMSFAVTGKYEDIKSFLRDLEDSLRVVEIEKLSIEPKDKDLGSGGELDVLFNQSTTTEPVKKETFYKAGITIKTFWLKKEEYE